MEKLLQYVWKHKLFPLKELETTDGFKVEVIDSGQQNMDAGPDFFNAKVKINGTLWVGNVEIHDRSSHWYLHHHEIDEKYNNVILHVASDIDADVETQEGNFLPQLQLDVPDHIRKNYEELLAADKYPPCYKIIPSLTRLMIHSWMNTLQTERLEEKTLRIEELARRCNNDWEKAYFVTLSRNFGFGVNSDACEQWAMSIPLNNAAHHRDDIFQIEAFFLGQAGLLEKIKSDYAEKLIKEYAFLKHKFTLEPIDKSLWNFLRMRPNNFPYIRISQLANMYYEGKISLSKLIECQDIKDLRDLYTTKATPVWGNTKKLSKATVDVLIINTAIPMLFAYGRHKGNKELCNRAFDFFEALKPESNHIITMWSECGLEVASAGDSQALIQLKKEYCNKKDCLRCRIGYEYLKK